MSNPKVEIGGTISEEKHTDQHEDFVCGIWFIMTNSLTILIYNAKLWFSEPLSKDKLKN